MDAGMIIILVLVAALIIFTPLGTELKQMVAGCQDVKTNVVYPNLKACNDAVYDIMSQYQGTQKASVESVVCVKKEAALDIFHLPQFNNVNEEPAQYTMNYVYCKTG